MRRYEMQVIDVLGESVDEYASSRRTTVSPKVESDSGVTTIDQMSCDVFVLTHVLTMAMHQYHNRTRIYRWTPGGDVKSNPIGSS